MACKKTDLKFSTVCEKCQKTAGRRGGGGVTHTVVRQNWLI